MLKRILLLSNWTSTISKNKHWGPTRSNGIVFPRKKNSRLHYQFLIFAILCKAIIFTGCSSSTVTRLQEKRDAGNPHFASYAAEGFTMDQRSPEPRPQRAWQFYYKNCSLVSRNRFPNKTEFECSDPR